MYYKFNKQKLLFEKTKIPYGIIIVVVGLLTILPLIINSSSYINSTVNILSQEEKLIIIREYNEFSEPKLIKKIKELNFKYPHIILAQSKLETGNFKSIIFKENSNLFGMKEAKLRANLAKGTRRSHAYYDSWQESVLDYALYYSTYLYRIRTEGEYFEYLRQNYAEDPSYVQRLKKIIDNQNLKDKKLWQN